MWLLSGPFLFCAARGGDRKDAKAQRETQRAEEASSCSRVVLILRPLRALRRSLRLRVFAISAISRAFLRDELFELGNGHAVDDILLRRPGPPRDAEAAGELVGKLDH